MKKITGDIIFFIGHINYIGGVEQWIYYIAKKYSKNHDITCIYKKCAPAQLKRLEKLIRCIKYTDEEIECNKIEFCYDFSIIDKVKAKDYELTIHSDYKAQNIKINIPKQITKIYAVSELVKKTFEEMYHVKCELLYNPILLDKPKKILKLISATRLTSEKGGELMKKIAKAFHDSNIPFIWLVFTDKPSNSETDEFIYMKPRLDIDGYIKEADYLVQVSKTEGFSYSIVQSLCLGTPAIVTDIPVIKEIGIEDGKNGYILDMQLKNLDVNKIYNNIPKFKYVPKESEKKWDNLLGESKETLYNYEDMLKSIVEVRAKKSYFDVELNKKMAKNETFNVTGVRANYLENLELIER
jgi:glycosyltransferase involved in cell wall biosynthesis